MYNTTPTNEYGLTMRLEMYVDEDVRGAGLSVTDRMFALNLIGCLRAGPV